MISLAADESRGDRPRRIRTSEPPVQPIREQTGGQPDCSIAHEPVGGDEDPRQKYRPTQVLGCRPNLRHGPIMPELFAIDPRTVFLVAMLMMLLNGGVLGLMHGSLAPDVQPSAFSWRVGTLLQAAGCVLQAVQQSLPPAFVLPLANALLLLGMTAYLRALRQFYGLPERWSLLLPPLLATVAVFWFTAVHPDLGLRITLVSLT